MPSQTQKVSTTQDNLNLLARADAMANLAVKDIARAKTFYGDTLGFKQLEDNGDVISYQTGNSTLLVYKSEFAGTNRATAATWDVGHNIEAIVSALKDKGVSFESYDVPETKREGDIYVGNDMKVAWFKDPDGNILCLVSG